MGDVGRGWQGGWYEFVVPLPASRKGGGVSIEVLVHQAFHTYGQPLPFGRSWKGEPRDLPPQRHQLSAAPFDHPAQVQLQQQRLH